MTIIACPHGCGGTCDTAKDDYCPSCRRGLNETEVVIPEGMDTAPKYDAQGEEVPGPHIGPTHRKASWCWQWHGAPDHRMRCRLPLGHAGEHDCKHDRQPGEISVSTGGQVVHPRTEPKMGKI